MKSLDDYLRFNYRYQLEKEDDGTIFASHPDLPGCAAVGATADEAIANLDDARQLWISVRLENGLHVPDPPSLPENLSECRDETELAEYLCRVYGVDRIPTLEDLRNSKPIEDIDEHIRSKLGEELLR